MLLSSMRVAEAVDDESHMGGIPLPLVSEQKNVDRLEKMQRLATRMVGVQRKYLRTQIDELGTVFTKTLKD